MTAEVVDIAEARPPIIVHKPRHFRKAWKTFQKHGPLTKYLTVCSREVNIAEGVVIRKCDEGPYLVAGPHERYYEGCTACGYIPDR